MKILFSLFLFLFSLSAVADTSLDDVLDLYARGVGGKKALESVQSVEISLTIQEPKFTVDAIYQTDRKIRMRIDIYSEGKRVFTEAFDGKKGWQMEEDGVPKDASVQGATALRNGIFLPGKLFGLYELPALGHKISYEGRQDIDHVSYYVLRLTLDSGVESYFYIHPETGRIERTRENLALHVDVDSTKQATESKASDFRNVDGVLYAFQSVKRNLKTNEVIQTVTIKTIKLNPTLDDSLFRKP